MPPEAKPSNIEVKICGINRAESVDAAVAGGAHYIGFVFYPPSPRNLRPGEARALTELIPTGVLRVALFVDPTDAEINRVLDQNRFDIIQLHGGETPDRVAEIRGLTGLEVMKAVKLYIRDDLVAAATYRGADRLLFDAMAPKDRTNALPGGNALAFDWKLLAGAKILVPWMLAGGLTAKNLAQAVAMSGAKAVDVSSGVEDAPGIKNPDKIRAFLAAAAGI